MRDDAADINWTRVGDCERCGGPFVQRCEWLGQPAVRTATGPRWCVSCGESECCGARLDARLLRALGTVRRAVTCAKCGGSFLLNANATATAWVLARA